MGLRELRTEHVLSQQDLAERAQVSKTTIVQIETGRSQPYPSTVRKIAAALDMEPREVLHQLRAERGTA